MQNKDKSKAKSKSYETIAYEEIIGKLKWKWKSFKSCDAFYACITYEIFGTYDAQTRLKIRQNVYDYIKQNKDNKQYFEKIYCKYINDTIYYSLPHIIRKKKKENAKVDDIDLFAISELYNVRIIVFEYQHFKKIVLSKNKCYVSCPNIPLIILSKIQRGGQVEWGIITDTHDVSNTVPPMMNLIE